jgi:hypothetical protein
MKGLLWAVVMIRADDVGPGPSISWSQDGYALRKRLDGRTTTADLTAPGLGRRAKAMSCSASIRIVFPARLLGEGGLTARLSGGMRDED